MDQIDPKLFFAFLEIKGSFFFSLSLFISLCLLFFFINFSIEIHILYSTFTFQFINNLFIEFLSDYIYSNSTSFYYYGIYFFHKIIFIFHADIGKCSQVCSLWHKEINEDEELWRELFLYNFTGI